MGSFPVEFDTTTLNGFLCFRVLHSLAFIKGQNLYPFSIFNFFLMKKA